MVIATFPLESLTSGSAHYLWHELHNFAGIAFSVCDARCEGFSCAVKYIFGGSQPKEFTQLNHMVMNLTQDKICNSEPEECPQWSVPLPDAQSSIK